MECREYADMVPLEKELKESEPPAGFVDPNTYVKRLIDGELVTVEVITPERERYRYDPTKPGCKGEFLGVLPPLKEGITAVSISVRNNLIPPRTDKDEILARYKELQAQGISTRQAAKMLNVPEGTLYGWLAKEKEKQPLESEKQVPAQEELQKAVEAITDVAEENTPLPVEIEKIITELREDLDIERKKIAELERKVGYAIDLAKQVKQVGQIGNDTKPQTDIIADVIAGIIKRLLGAA